MLKAIERPRQLADMTEISSVDEFSGLLTIDMLGKVSIKKSIGDIHLINMPATRNRKLENGADRARFDNRWKRLCEVNSSALAKTTDHPASLIALKRAIRAGLMVKDPLAADDVGVRRPGKQYPSAVPLKSVELVLHRGEPMRITEGCLHGGGKW